MKYPPEREGEALPAKGGGVGSAKEPTMGRRGGVGIAIDRWVGGCPTRGLNVKFSKNRGWEEVDGVRA